MQYLTLDFKRHSNHQSIYLQKILHYLKIYINKLNNKQHFLTKISQKYLKILKKISATEE